MAKNPSMIYEQKFRKMFKRDLGGNWLRALTIFRNCDKLVYDATIILKHAIEQSKIDQGKIDEVLEIMEDHYQATEMMLIRLREETLGLEP